MRPAFQGEKTAGIKTSPFIYPENFQSWEDRYHMVSSMYVCPREKLLTQMWLAVITHPERFSVLFLGNVPHFNILHSLLWKHLQSWTEQNRKQRISDLKQCGRSEERVNNLVDIYPLSPVPGWNNPPLQSDDKTPLHNPLGILPSTTNNPLDAALKNVLIWAKPLCLYWNIEVAH